MLWVADIFHYVGNARPGFKARTPQRTSLGFVSPPLLCNLRLAQEIERRPGF
jgi:hypothetical protein